MAPPQQLRQQTSNCSLLLIYRPQKDKRLSWPGWLTYSGWFTQISGHPSATGRAQDSKSMPAKDRCYTAGPHNQPSVADIQCAAAVIRRGKKEEERKKIETTGKNIMACPVSHGGQKVTETRVPLNVTMGPQGYVNIFVKLLQVAQFSI